MSRATRTPSASPLPTFKVEGLTEAEMERVLVRAGGSRAHLDADRRDRRGADFVIGNTVIELKILEEEGLDNPERQRKLAELFRPQFPTRPTIVIDRNALDDKGKRAFDNISDSRIKKLVASAREQFASVASGARRHDDRALGHQQWPHLSKPRQSERPCCQARTQ